VGDRSWDIGCVVVACIVGLAVLAIVVVAFYSAT
jgi:hypothetical protein